MRLSPKCGNNLLQVGLFPTAVEFVPVCDSTAILQRWGPRCVSPSGNLMALLRESLVSEDRFSLASDIPTAMIHVSLIVHCFERSASLSKFCATRT